MTRKKLWSLANLPGPSLQTEDMWLARVLSSFPFMSWKYSTYVFRNMGRSVFPSEIYRSSQHLVCWSSKHPAFHQASGPRAWHPTLHVWNGMRVCLVVSTLETPATTCTVMWCKRKTHQYLQWIAMSGYVYLKNQTCCCIYLPYYISICLSL